MTLYWFSIVFERALILQGRCIELLKAYGQTVQAVCDNLR